MAGAAGVECEEIPASGRSPTAIMQLSDEVDADLVVVDFTGMTSLECALMGSESESLMRYSGRAVLLIHEP